MKCIFNFLHGITIPFKAIALIFGNRAVFLWALLPLLCSGLLYLALWSALIAPLRDWITLTFQNWLLGILGAGTLTQVQTILRWLVMETVQIIMFVVMIFTFATFANIVALPINDFLAQATERALTPPLSRPPSSGFWNEASLVWLDFKKNIFSLLGLVVCLAVAWIPVLNLAAIVCAWLLLTYQYISYPQTRRGIGATDAAIELWRNFGLCAGFGLTIAGGLSIPVLSIFIPPIAVVGGTMLFAVTDRAHEQKPL